MKEAKFGSEAREKMLAGFDKAAKLVAMTLGPKGRNVYLDDPLMPHVVDDGATIAQNCVFPDKYENIGAYIIRNTSNQTNDDAGDGTSTTAVLTHAIVHESLGRPESPRMIAESLTDAVDEVVSEIKKRSQKVKDIHQVALISAENEQLAKIITEVVEKRGIDTLFTIQDSRDGSISHETVEGYEAHVGYIAPVFMTDTKKARAVYDDVPVLVAEKKIGTITDIQEIFNGLATAQMNRIVIVCNEIDEALLNTFALTHMTRKMNILVIRATGPLLEDIAGAVGATMISDTTGVSFATFDIFRHLGKAKRIECGSSKTLFVPQDKEKAHEYSLLLESRADAELNQYAKKKLKERVAKLREGVVVLKIGASTDFERENLKLKAEDATHAVKCALEEGVVDGGGTTLYHIARKMKADTVGKQILKRALKAPFRTIIENAGADYTEIASEMPEGMGWDARNEKYCDFHQEGIVDPAKVERLAVKNAVSAAAQFITSGAAIVDYVEPK